MDGAVSQCLYLWIVQQKQIRRKHSVIDTSIWNTEQEKGSVQSPFITGLEGAEDIFLLTPGL